MEYFELQVEILLKFLFEGLLAMITLMVAMIGFYKHVRRQPDPSES